MHSASSSGSRPLGFPEAPRSHQVSPDRRSRIAQDDAEPGLRASSPAVTSCTRTVAITRRSTVWTLKRLVCLIRARTKEHLRQFGTARASWRRLPGNEPSQHIARMRWYKGRVWLMRSGPLRLKRPPCPCRRRARASLRARLDPHARPLRCYRLTMQCFSVSSKRVNIFTTATAWRIGTASVRAREPRGEDQAKV